MSGAGARGQPGSQLGKKGGHELREARGKWDLRRPLDPGSDARCLRIPASVVEGLCGRSRRPSSTLELSRHLFPDCASENLKEPLEEQVTPCCLIPWGPASTFLGQSRDTCCPTSSLHISGRMSPVAHPNVELRRAENSGKLLLS